MLFTIGTVEPAIPLTVVDKVLAEDVLLMLLTAGAVAATPFTVLVMVFALLDKVCVVAPLNTVAAAV